MPSDGGPDASRLQELVERLPVALMTFRCSAESAAVVLVHVNPAADFRFDAQLSPRLGRPIEEVLPLELASALGPRCRRAVHREKTLRTVVESTEGIFETVIYPSAPLEATVILSDVSERARHVETQAQAQAALEQKDEDLLSTQSELQAQADELDSLKNRHLMSLRARAVAFFDIDWPTRTVEGDARARSLLGQAQDAPLAVEGWLKSLEPYSAQVLSRALSDMEAGRAHHSELVLETQGGAPRYLQSVLGATFRSSDGSLVRVSGAVIDITEEQERLRALERANRELERFAYLISHDLKAPLRGIRLAAGWLRDEWAGALSPDGEENLGFIESRVGRLSRMIDGVLSHSQARLAVLHHEVIDPRVLLEDVLTDLSARKLARIEVTGDFPTLRGDAGMVSRVMLNLIDNALRFAGGRARIDLVGALDAHVAWQLSVSDNGPGISPEHHETVFQLFKTLKSRDERESTGAGLAVCKELVQRWGGDIGVGPSDLGGARFWFSHPLASDTLAPSS